MVGRVVGGWRADKVNAMMLAAFRSHMALLTVTGGQLPTMQALMQVRGTAIVV